MEEQALPKRRPNRLQGFKYDSTGVYFITICTRNKEHLFWHQVGASIARPQECPLTEIGLVVKNHIEAIPSIYPLLSICNFVIMPNHIHLLLRIHDSNGRAMLAPTISRVIQHFKGSVSKALGFSIWQKLFYDHIVRSRDEYDKINAYIENNPQNWETDELYN